MTIGHLEQALSEEGIVVHAGLRGVTGKRDIEDCFHITIHDVNLNFRLLTKDTLLIPLVRRGVARSGLASGLKSLVWLGSFLARRQELRILWVCGAINTSLYREDAGLNDERLQRFYTDYLGCEVIAADSILGLSDLDREAGRKGNVEWVRASVLRFPKALVHRRGRGAPAIDRSAAYA